MLADRLNRAIEKTIEMICSKNISLQDVDTKIIVNGEATILIIGDEKTVVKCTEGEKFDIEKGIAMALLKHAGMTRGDMARLINSVDNQNEKMEHERV